MTTYLIDTNVLLRFVKADDRDYSVVRSAISRLWVAGDELFYTSQNLAEFWSTCTRSVERNGYGLTIAEADRRARLIEEQFSLLVDSSLVHKIWRELVVVHAVSGVQVYDARLVAAMSVHQISNILTFNTRDFVRYSQITAIAPEALVGT